MQQIITRLKAEVPALQIVQGAAEYAAISGLKDFRPPCAYALLVSERPDNEAPKNNQQRAVVTFGVVVVGRNYRDQRGQETLDALGPIIGATRQALIGWLPAETGGRKTKWMGGDVMDWDANTVLWADVYETQHFIGA